MIFLLHTAKLGILLLCGSTNMHIFWTIWEIIQFYLHNTAYEIRSGILFAWYFGAIIGFMGGAGLNNIWTKKWIYVRAVHINFEIFYIYA